MIENITPILRVDDLRRSLEFYTRKLGFALDWDLGDYAGISRDFRGIMLCEGGQGNPGTWVWIGVEDVQALHAEFATRGVEFVHGPRNYSWAMEMKVRDPDGHMLRFGSESDPSKPFEAWAE